MHFINLDLTFPVYDDPIARVSHIRQLIRAQQNNNYRAYIEDNIEEYRDPDYPDARDAWYDIPSYEEYEEWVKTDLIDYLKAFEIKTVVPIGASSEGTMYSVASAISEEVPDTQIIADIGMHLLGPEDQDAEEWRKTNHRENEWLTMKNNGLITQEQYDFNSRRIRSEAARENIRSWVLLEKRFAHGGAGQPLEVIEESLVGCDVN